MGYLLEDRSYQLGQEVLIGAIDIHVRAGPRLQSSPRRVDPFQAAIEARDAGMRAIVLMDVFALSTFTAWLFERIVVGIDNFGGIILNTLQGSMNPRAVKNFGVRQEGRIRKIRSALHSLSGRPRAAYGGWSIPVANSTRSRFRVR